VLDKLTQVGKEYRIFTQYNLAGTITGRLSSDFQQFPKESVKLNDGTEVNIRSWFVVPKQDKYMFYFDYSQMELRLQCEWTNIVNGQPDMNMARAFTPYKCIEKDGKYFLEEDPTKEWKPTDLHALTAKNAFPNIDESHPDWKQYRNLGKRTNFAVNYGAAAPKIQQALKVDFPTAQALVQGYRKAFAGVVAFGKWISNRVYVTDNIPNLLLRRYYSRNKHQLQNWLVQGSGADILLLKLREIFEYIKNKPHWKFMITVHDELGFVCADIPQEQLKREVKDIQKLMTHSMSAVDIVSDVEYTTTKWSEKDEWTE
jgi:DNA polymerase-1